MCPSRSAVVVPTRSSINVGEDGSYNGTGFQLTGHVQLSNEDGATWDEFYLGFSTAGRRSFRDVKSYRRRKRWL